MGTFSAHEARRHGGGGPRDGGTGEHGGTTRGAAHPNGEPPLVRARPVCEERVRQTFSVLMDVGAWPGSVAISSNSTTFPMSFVVDIEMLVTRSRIASTTTGTRYSAASFLACSKAAPSSAGS